MSGKECREANILHCYAYHGTGASSSVLVFVSFPQSARRLTIRMTYDDHKCISVPKQKPNRSTLIAFAETLGKSVHVFCI